jgi:hypothetical protein
MRGPLVTIPGVSGVAVPGNTTTGEVEFVWYRDALVTGLCVMARSGLLADSGALSIAIQDGDRNALVTDGRNDLFAPFLALTGTATRFFALSLAARRGEPWIFRIRNASAGPLTPIVFFQVEDP